MSKPLPVFISVLLLAAVTFCTPQRGICQQQISKGFFEKSELLFNRGKLNYNNDNGHVAWTISQLVDAYVKLYLVTGNTDYIKKASVISKEIYRNTDSKKGKRDIYGQSKLLWSSTKYSEGQKRVSWVVHTGMITYAIAAFCEVVLDNKKLHLLKDQEGELLIDVAGKLKKDLEVTIASHDREWNNRGYYSSFPDYPTTASALKGKALPHNQYLALGRTHIILYRITGKTEYMRKAKLMASYFKSNLELKENGYIWKYHPDLRYEDISHGAIDAAFAYECYRQGWIYTKQDMVRFSNTIEGAINGNLQVNNLVYGSKAVNKYKLAVPLWSRYAQFNSNLKRKISGIVKTITVQPTKNIAIFSAIAESYYYQIQ